MASFMFIGTAATAFSIAIADSDKEFVHRPSLTAAALLFYIGVGFSMATNLMQTRYIVLWIVGSVLVFTLILIADRRCRASLALANEQVADQEVSN